MYKYVISTDLDGQLNCSTSLAKAHKLAKYISLEPRNKDKLVYLAEAHDGDIGDTDITNYLNGIKRI